jgi:hypothetical protein
LAVAALVVEVMAQALELLGLLEVEVEVEID